jgi:hypothetical protein
VGRRHISILDSFPDGDTALTGEGDLMTNGDKNSVPISQLLDRGLDNGPVLDNIPAVWQTVVSAPFDGRGERHSSAEPGLKL